MSHYIIFGNYGNETIGLMQWTAEQKLHQITVVSVETFWSAEAWSQQVQRGEDLARDKGFAVVRLQAKLGFAELIKEQQNFPGTQYQWCANFLKALPFIDWLDEHDPQCQAVLMLGNRRALAKGQATLAEYIDESEHFGGRKVWHPLYQHSHDDLAALLQRAGFDYLPHRSLECDPCVNNTAADFLRLNKMDRAKTQALEAIVHTPMFAPASYGDNAGIEHVIQWVEKNNKSATLQPRDMGCGSPFGCGL